MTKHTSTLDRGLGGTAASPFQRTLGGFTPEGKEPSLTVHEVYLVVRQKEEQAGTSRGWELLVETSGDQPRSEDFLTATLKAARDALPDADRSLLVSVFFGRSPSRRCIHVRWFRSEYWNPPMDTSVEFFARKFLEAARDESLRALAYEDPGYEDPSYGGLRLTIEQEPAHSRRMERGGPSQPPGQPAAPEEQEQTEWGVLPDFAPELAGFREPLTADDLPRLPQARIDELGAQHREALRAMVTFLNDLRQYHPDTAPLPKPGSGGTVLATRAATLVREADFQVRCPKDRGSQLECGRPGTLVYARGQFQVSHPQRQGQRDICMLDKLDILYSLEARLVPRDPPTGAAVAARIGPEDS